MTIVNPCIMLTYDKRRLSQLRKLFMTLITSQVYEITDMELVAEKAKDYIANAKSKNTRKSYRSDWKDFDQWCKAKRLTTMPASPETVVAYLIEKAEILKMATLDRRLVSIRQAHSMAGHLFDKGHMLIKETLKGIKNTHGKPQTAKAPILLEDLRSMVNNLGDGLHGIRDRALLLLGFIGAFRRSELVSLKVEDLRFTREGIEVMLRRSKTDQEGKGTILPIPYGSNPETCPVRSIQSWLELSGIKDGYLLRAVNKHGHISGNGMNPASVSLIIKRNDHIKGRKIEFGGHSLRAGFCTQAAINGVSAHASMKQARQKKVETHQKYIRIANMWQDCAATKLGL